MVQLLKKTRSLTCVSAETVIDFVFSFSQIEKLKLAEGDEHRKVEPHSEYLKVFY